MLFAFFYPIVRDQSFAAQDGFMTARITLAQLYFHLDTLNSSSGK